MKIFAVLAELAQMMIVERVRISLGNRAIPVKMQTSVSIRTMALRVVVREYAVLVTLVGRAFVVIAQPISRVVKRQTPVMGMA